MGLPQDSRTNTVTSSAGLDPAALGHFDLRQLKLYRDMAERHLNTALSAVTAAGDPGEYVYDYFLTEFADSAYATWADARGLIGALFGDLPTPFYESIAVSAIKDSTNAYQQLLQTLVGRKGFPRVPIQGEFLLAADPKKTGALVQYGDVRPLLTRLGGGSTEASVPLMGGITSGLTMREWLRSNGIDMKEKIWLYGDEARRNMNGHMQMDGLVFTDWDDPGLLISPQDAWLRRTHYQIGDHWGCGCCVAPYIPNFDAPYALEFPSS